MHADMVRSPVATVLDTVRETVCDRDGVRETVSVGERVCESDEDAVSDCDRREETEIELVEQRDSDEVAEPVPRLDSATVG